MPTTYPEQLVSLLSACEKYRSDELDLDALKSQLWKTAEVVVSVEESEFRRYLQSVEGKLDILQATEENVRASSLSIIDEIEARLRTQLE